MSLNQEDFAEIRQQSKATLEDLVDKSSLEFVVTTLAKICHERAAQLRLASTKSPIVAKERGYNAVMLDRAVIALRHC